MYMVYVEYFWLLSGQVQFGVIRCISSVWWPCIYFWLKYLGIFVLLSFYIPSILVISNWPSRVSRPLGLLFEILDLCINWTPCCLFVSMLINLFQNVAKAHIGVQNARNVGLSDEGEWNVVQRRYHAGKWEIMDLKMQKKKKLLKACFSTCTYR